MSSIDKRIVEMQFDNKQFEQGIAQSQKSLAGFSKSLISNTASGGMLTLANSADVVAQRFSAMGIIGMTVLQNITNSAYNAAKAMIKSLSTDQISAGMTKYEQKIANMQSLMNATGDSLETVNGYMERLMWFSDETSFGFTDMTQALSSMVIAGGDVKDILPTIEGLANATAFSGKGPEEYQRAIQAVTKAYSQGHLDLLSMKTLTGSGVMSKQLKEVMIAAGEAAGTIKKGQVTIENFDSTLQKKWATKGVMESSLGRFAEFSTAVRNAVKDRIYPNTSAAIAGLANQFDPLIVQAFKAAQSAKTFTEAIEATKDAVSSGWMTTLEHVIGNITEATELWTEVTRVLWEVFAGGAEARNDMLADWAKLGGRKRFLLGLQNIYNSVAMLVYAINQAFRQIFPKNDVDSLLGKTESFRRVTYSIFKWINGVVGGAPRYEHITKIFAGLFSVFKVGITILKAVGTVIGDVFRMFVPGASDGFLVFFGGIGDSLVAFSEKFDKIAVINKLRNWLADLLVFLSPAIIWITNNGQKLTKAVREFFTGDGLEGEAHNKTGFQVLIETLTKWYNKAKAILKVVTTFITIAATAFITAIRVFFLGDGLEGEAHNKIAFQVLLEKFVKWYNTLKTFLAPAIAWIKRAGLDLKNAFLGLFVQNGKGAKGKSKSILETMQDAFSTPEGKKNVLQNLMTTLTTTWNNLKTFIKDLYKSVNESVSGAFTNFGNALKGIWDFLKGNWKWIVGGLAVLGIAKLAWTVFSFIRLLKQIQAAKLGVGDKQFSRKMLEIAGSIAIIVAAIVVVTKIKPEELHSALIVLGGIGLFLAAISWVGSKSKGSGAIGKGMLAMAAGIYIIILAVQKVYKILGTMDDPARMNKSLIAVGALLVGLALISRLMGGKKFSKNWKPIVALAAGVWLIIKALKPLAKMEWIELGKMGAGLVVIGLVIAGLMAVSKLGGGNPAKLGGILALAIGIWAIIKVLTPLGKMNEGELTQMGVALGALTVAIGIMLGLSSLGNVGSGFGALLALAGMAGVIWTVGDALSKVQNVDPTVIEAFCIGVTMMIAALAVTELLAGINALSGINTALGGGALSAVIYFLGDALARIAEAGVEPDVIKAFTEGVALMMGLMTFNMLVGGALPLAGLNSLLSNGSLAAVIGFFGEALAKIAEAKVDTGLIEAFTAGVVLMLGANNLGTFESSLSPLVGLNTLIADVGLVKVIDSLSSALAKVNGAEVDEGLIASFTGAVVKLLDANNGLGKVNTFMDTVGLLFESLDKGSLSGVIEKLGEALTAVATAGVTAEQTTAFTESVIKIMEFAQELKTKGFGEAVSDVFFGTAIQNFADDMQAYSDGIISLTKAMSTVEFPFSLIFRTKISIIVANLIVKFIDDLKKTRIQTYGDGDASLKSVTASGQLKTDIENFSDGVAAISKALNVSNSAEIEGKTRDAIAAVSAIKSFLSTLGDDAEFQKLIDEDKTGWQKFWGDTSATDKLSSAITTFSTGVNDLGEAFATITIGEGGFEAKVESVKTGLTSIAGFLATLSTDPDLKNLMGIDGYTLQSTTFITQLGEIGRQIEIFNSNIPDASSTKFSQVASAVKTLMDSISGLSELSSFSALSTIGKNLETLGRIVGAAITTGVSGGVKDGEKDPVLASIDRLGTEGLNNLGSHIPGFITAGLNFAKGVEQGILNGIYLAEKAAALLGRRVLRSLKNSIDEHSPSKEAGKSGTNFVLGFSGAIEDNTKVAAAASSNLGTAASSALAKSSGGGGEKPAANALDKAIAWLKTGGEKVAASLSDTGAKIKEAVQKEAPKFDFLMDLESVFGSSSSNSSSSSTNTSNTKNTKTSTAAAGITTKAPVLPVNYLGTVGTALTQTTQTGLLAERIEALGKAVTSMRVVMDSGALVGQITSGIDKQLGMAASYAGRG